MLIKLEFHQSSITSYEIVGGNDIAKKVFPGDSGDISENSQTISYKCKLIALNPNNDDQRA